MGILWFPPAPDGSLCSGLTLDSLALLCGIIPTISSSILVEDTKSLSYVLKSIVMQQ